MPQNNVRTMKLSEFIGSTEFPVKIHENAQGIYDSLPETYTDPVSLATMKAIDEPYIEIETDMNVNLTTFRVYVVYQDIDTYIDVTHMMTYVIGQISEDIVNSAGDDLPSAVKRRGQISQAYQLVQNIDPAKLHDNVLEYIHGGASLPDGDVAIAVLADLVIDTNRG